MKQQSSVYYSGNEDDTDFFDVYELFQLYNIQFFYNQLEKCTVRWTKRMTLCAGTCKYQGFGSSTISLSQPLLKFRSSNQLKQTLLHQMIHAYLFKTNPAACQTDGGHGPAFIQIMHKINKLTGLNITTHHSFHNEVNFYRQHVWKCNGRCQNQPPFYGYVKRSMNRAPQPADHWFAQHKRVCGGQFIKISEPVGKKSKQKDKNKQKKLKKIQKQKSIPKGKGKTIQQYINQMNKNNDRKKKKQKQSPKQRNASEENQKPTDQRSTSNSMGSNDYMLKKAKTIEQYCKQIQQQERQKNKQKQGSKNPRIDQLIKKYQKQ